MKKYPVLMFFLLRIGVFAAVFAIVFSITREPFASAFAAAAVGLAISLLFFNSHRAGMSESIERWLNRKNDKDAAAEDNPQGS